jgi:hypothetical protein
MGTTTTPRGSTTTRSSWLPESARGSTAPAVSCRSSGLGASTSDAESPVPEGPGFGFDQHMQPPLVPMVQPELVRPSMRALRASVRYPNAADDHSPVEGGGSFTPALPRICCRRRLVTRRSRRSAQPASLPRRSRIRPSRNRPLSVNFSRTRSMAASVSPTKSHCPRWRAVAGSYGSFRQTGPASGACQPSTPQTHRASQDPALTSFHGIETVGSAARIWHVSLCSPSGRRRRTSGSRPA